MKKAIRLFVDFVAAVTACFVLASLFHTQSVLYRLIELGVDIDFSTRLSTSLDDMIGLFPAYGGTIFLALLIGFSVAALIQKIIKRSVPELYLLAGCFAMLTALLAMHPILNITLIAGARSSFGMGLQSIAGIFGGWVFMYQRKRANASENAVQ
ncbi:hypothetical protein [Aliiglaciecola sp. M165]|uniref:hypothetical protein n=1 Tax=Aliiglaciecola sp. M165 TaxID=2593649 RepID=UPI00117F4CAC|nr:hypothetical protein [Aliiglaciecola sp. M165]TRY30584.1 hypothetical protein FM019_11850 [Aliiglaciecola sp. M165]